MELERRRIAPGAKLIWTCPEHPETTLEAPGPCPKEGCGRKLQFRIVSETTRLAEGWTCPLHPLKSAEGKEKCPECGGEMKHMESEEVLAVPADAVIDTGSRKVVFVERSAGTFDALEVVLGPRAGAHFQVLKGLAAGDRVVSAGAFLLDAEARLNPAAGVVYFGAGGQEGGR